jgi:hypothetical protein
MIVEAPDGHQIVAATPEPTVEDDRAIWGADQQLDSFSVTIDAVEGTDGKDSDDSGQAGTAGATSPDDTGAGFGFLLSALTLGGLLLVTRLRE